MPLSLLIVDDEELSRYALRTMIMKHVAEDCRIREADSGPAALDLIDGEPYDLVFLDIRIPGLDGLETARRMLERHPRIPIYMISAHDNFEYARRALELGVKGYLLKPFRTDELLPCFERLASEPQNSDVQAQRSREALERGLVQACASGDEQAALLYAEALDFRFGTGFFVAVGGLPEGEPVPIRSRLPYLFRKALIRSGDPAVLLVPVFENDIFYKEDLILKAAGEFMHRLRGRNKCRCGIGPLGASVSELAYSYSCALGALTQAQEGSGLLLRELATASQEGKPLAGELEARFAGLVEEGRYGEAVAETAAVLAEAQRSGIQAAGLAEAATEFLVVARNFLRKLGFIAENRAIRDIVIDFSSVSSAEDIVLRFEKQLAALVQGLGVSPAGVTDPKRLRILNFVNRNLFNKDLSLNMVSERFSCSNQYLARVFNDCCAVGFKEYVTERRIGLAKHHLAESELTVGGVADRVGFSDVNYFCRVFKKMTGMRPNEYRSRSRTDARAT